jgi:hypothetical protein
MGHLYYLTFMTGSGKFQKIFGKRIKIIIDESRFGGSMALVEMRNKDMKLFQNPDGANASARAVLALLQSRDGINESWNEARKNCDAVPEVDRWHNCREQGYIISLKGPDYRNQLNIVFYEHRNSDGICALMWEQTSLNPINLATIKEGVFNSSSDYTYSVNHNEITEMAAWIMKQLTQFWVVEAAKATAEAINRNLLKMKKEIK